MQINANLSLNYFQFMLCGTFWRDFVITETKAMLAHSYLLKFSQAVESLYGKDKVTPNMHLHTHLVDRVLDYGPVYAFWLFSFERYNGILGEFKTNQRSVEIQIMRKFTCNQFIQDMPLPSVFKNVFNPILDRLASNQAGTLDQSLSGKESLSSTVIKVSLLSIGPVRKCVEYACNDSLFTSCGPSSRSNVDAYALPHRIKCYNTIFDRVDETSVTTRFEKFASCQFNGDLFGSSATRSDRSSFVLARWCKLGGLIDTSGRSKCKI